MGTGLLPLIEVAKNLAHFNAKGHGEVPYQKPQLKLMVYGVYPRIEQYYGAMHSTNST